MSTSHATAYEPAAGQPYTADELEGVYVLLAEAQESLAVGDEDDCRDCIESVMERLGLRA